MKKFLNVLLAAVGVVLLSIVSSLSYNHYVNKVDPGITTEDTLTGVQVAETMAQVINPTFKSTDDVREFYQHEIERISTDSVFMAIPYDVLINISQVVIGRNGHADKKSIVEEFRQNYKPVYQYIKPKEIEQLQTLKGDSIKLPPNIRADTIINGKKFQLIKETVSNE